MSTFIPQDSGEPIRDTAELVAYFRRGEKSSWRLGSEYELLALRQDSFEPPDHASGIGPLLGALASNGWQGLREGENMIAAVRGSQSVTIEPGGQVEIVTAPHPSAAAVASELNAILGEVRAHADRCGIALAGAGFQPWATRDGVPWMPKSRYAVMRDYLPRRGGLALDMMKRTATVQTSVDYGDERDAAEKMRCVFAATPVFTALFANSPLVESGLTGHQSFRAQVWRDTDPDRSGIPRFVFERDDIYTAYTEWALDVPMFFIHRGDYIPLHGLPFREYLRSGAHGHVATMADWELHLTTLFPEARLKHYVEIRGCDSGSPAMAGALGAFAVGILYSQDARRAVLDLTRALSYDQRMHMWLELPRWGLETPVPSTRHRVRDWAKECVTIAQASLTDPADRALLSPLEEIVHTGASHADRTIALWRKNPDPAAWLAEHRV